MSDSRLSSDRFALQEYRGRINRVIDYVDSRLDTELTLDELAGVANFSKYHFHRLFAAMTGETLFQFISRLRIEKAATLLAGNPKMTATEIAFACGFSGSAAFARAFRKSFSTTPTEWRKKYAGGSNPSPSNTGKHESNIRKTNGNGRKASAFLTEYPSDNTYHQYRRNTMTQGTVQIRIFPEETVAYIRHTGPYAGDAELFERLWAKLMAWAGPRKILDRPETKGLIVYHDSPGITEEEKLRLSVCLTVPEDTEVEGEVGKMTVPGGEYAVSRFSLSTDEYGEAWQWVFGTWLPESGYQPDERPCFEQYPEGDRADENGKTTVEIVVPVRVL